MTSKTISDCARCRLLAEYDTQSIGSPDDEQGKPDPCSPVIDAEKSNEALRMVAMIRERAGGTDTMAFTAEGKTSYQRK